MAVSNYNPVEGATEAQNRLLSDITAKFDISDKRLHEIAQEVQEYIVNGLQADDDENSHPRSLPCRVSYVKSEITQDIKEAEKEERLVLGLTINTSTERIKIASVKLVHGEPDAVNKQIFYMPKGINDPTRLFEAIAMHVAEFINSHNIVPPSLTEPLCLGVTVDLPLEETSKMGGRVACGSSVCHWFGNVDIAYNLNSALLKLHLPVKVTSTTNCVISTLVAAQRLFSQTRVALILNHGINASYYEAAAKIPKISGSELANSSALVAINTELARFGENSNALHPTMWDRRIDRESANTGKHIFEKLVADKYLGEIVRNLITDFMDAQLIFPKDADVTTFSEPYSFFTSYMTIMDDKSNGLHEIGELLKAGFNIEASRVDRQIVRALCSIVALRAARMVGAAVAGIYKKAFEAMSEPVPAVVSISGQLTDMNHPYVQCTIDTANVLFKMFGIEEVTFNVLGEDGYTVGAALTSLSK
ncbi:hypothetical protein LPJ66_002828 [Kickxella alabastrina]|uniref:Uncharacterized protein n=1 Tax=Kickxella alabastrina TaxID=61397 RepID=A0ACC1IPD7_9FUNG|nr:hypothetical protein LPJ66_002828 [Kickxella alabastrina]